MKQKDIIVIVAVAIVSGIISYVAANYLFSGHKTYDLTAPTVQPISSVFQLPSSTYFNQQSIDPTQDITIGNSTNSAPFNSQQ